MQTKSILKNFSWSFFFTIVGFIIAGWWGHNHGISVWHAVYIIVILAIMEISLSFDNAVVNATKLQEMSIFWRKIFLYFGIWVAVFGMRFYFPIEIVAVTTDKTFMQVLDLALNNPKEYSALLTKHHGEIAFFGGAFLFMVFFEFIFSEKDHYWLGKIEQKLSLLEDKKLIGPVCAFVVVAVFSRFVSEDVQTVCFIAGIYGIFLHMAVNLLGDMFDDGSEGGEVTKRVLKTGMAGFAGVMYLEVLDASFSFDGVMGAFAITNDVVLIMIGLAIGAFYVRSFTMAIVESNALTTFRYLEHGAHYAIGILALIMFVSTLQHLPEWIPGLAGVAFIVVSIYSSIKEKRREDKEALNKIEENKNI